MADEDDFDFAGAMDAFGESAKALSEEIQKESEEAARWLPAKLLELHQAQKGVEAATVVVLDQVAFEAQAPSIMGPWVSGDDFQADLKMSKLVWFYHQETKKRCLLAYYHPKDKAGGVAEMRALGKQAATQLQGRQIRVVDFVFASSIEGLADLVGDFENSFHAANYEKSYKRPKVQKEGEEVADPRTNRVTKNAEVYELHLEDGGYKSNAEYLFQRASAHALEFSKSLAQVRGSDATPEWMATQAQELVQGHELVKEIRIITGTELTDLGMNLIYNVGKAAESQPRCVAIHYVGRPEAADVVDLALVGKGVTYDTGGLNIKMQLMELMYGDKGGSTAVLGALKGCLELKPKKNIIFAAGFAENAIGRGAYKPSDILRAMNGLSVEIGNTDAEGRLVMADTATYVQRNFNPKKVVYIATLTGSCFVALGKTTAGLFANDDGMAAALSCAAKIAHEPVWRLPINDEHRGAIAGRDAVDVNNLGATRFGGACQAAAFLEKFVEDDREWAHIDIAGPGCLLEADQSGFGAKLLLSYIAKVL